MDPECGPRDSLLAFKNRGGLTSPSSSVVKIYEESELCFQRLISATCGLLPHEKRIDRAIVKAVFGRIDHKNVFSDLQNHEFELPITDNHVFALIKCVSKCYSKVRFHHMAREFNQKIPSSNVRKQFTKLILFKNQ